MDSTTPKGRGRPAKYSATLTHELKVRLSDELLAGLDWLAQREGFTRAEMIRNAIGTVVHLAQLTDTSKP